MTADPLSLYGIPENIAYAHSEEFFSATPPPIVS